MSYPPPRYPSATGETSATVVRADAPADLRIGASTEATYLATSATTDGLFGLYRWDMLGPRSGPDPHHHRTISESFYVLSGTVRLYDGNGWTDAHPGDFMHVPPGGVHGFRNESGEPASMLLLFAPGAPREAYFEELADIAASGRTLTDEERTELYARHDQYMA